MLFSKPAPLLVAPESTATLFASRDNVTGRAESEDAETPTLVRSFSGRLLAIGAMVMTCDALFTKKVLVTDPE